MNILLNTPKYQQLNENRGKLACAFCASLFVTLLAYSYSSTNNIAYKSYWVEIGKADLDKPALNSHISVLRYHARKTHAEIIEQRIDKAHGKLSNRQLIIYLNEVAGIYEEHHAARHPRPGVLNPS